MQQAMMKALVNTRVSTPFGTGQVIKLLPGDQVELRLEETGKIIPVGYADIRPATDEAPDVVEEEVVETDEVPTIKVNKALTDVLNEREYQIDRWGNENDDTMNTPFHWVTWITHYCAKWCFGGWGPFKRAQADTFRKMMVKVAALALAAVESLDRQREQDGHAFYEEDPIG